MATNAKEWKGRRGTELTLPSGNTCLVRNPGMQHFIKTGIIPDSLTGLVRKAIDGKKAEMDVSSIIKTEEDLARLFDLFDKVTMEVVIEPKVAPVPTESGKAVPFDERDEELLYIDEVDFDDKQFIFQFAVGGTRDLEQFRAGQKAMLGAVQSGEAVELSAERAG